MCDGLAHSFCTGSAGCTRPTGRDRSLVGARWHDRTWQRSRECLHFLPCGRGDGLEEATCLLASGPVRSRRPLRIAESEEGRSFPRKLVCACGSRAGARSHATAVARPSAPAALLWGGTVLRPAPPEDPLGPTPASLRARTESKAPQASVTALTNPTLPQVRT
jgi:hypothetical protein